MTLAILVGGIANVEAGWLQVMVLQEQGKEPEVRVVGRNATEEACRAAFFRSTMNLAKKAQKEDPNMKVEWHPQGALMMSRGARTVTGFCWDEDERAP
jgi:hypothetical protein